MHIFLSILAVLSAFITGMMYWFGLEEFYFCYYPWFDIPRHLVGGLTIGLWGASLAWRRRYSVFQAFVFVVLLALAVGLVWELFEYINGLTVGDNGYWFDTVGDLGNDVAGALVAWGLYWLLRPREDRL